MTDYIKGGSERTAMHAICIGSAMLWALAGCGQQALPRVGEERKAPSATSMPSTSTPVGLALEVENGAGVPIKVRAGQIFYINQLDIRASITATVDEGVTGLRSSGDFANLPWSGVRFADQEFVLPSNPDSTFTRRRFYRDAVWMTARSFFKVVPVDANGHATGTEIVVDAGKDGERKDSDDFFVRRLRAIQWTYDCPSSTSCTGARKFQEEALVELRNARHAGQTLQIGPSTTALRVYWTLRSQPYVIPIQQEAAPAFAYGFSIDVAPVTAPNPDGSYSPGSDVTFQLTLRDGAGNRLHPPGKLPAYNEVVFGANPAGIQYYRAFSDPTATYYRRKHRERMLMTQIIGPAQKIQPIRSIIDLNAFLGPDDVQTVGTRARDGVFAQFQTFPPAPDVFGGAFDPAHAGWAKPVSDRWTYHIPADAEAGTYLVTVKGRRTFMGEDVPFTKTIEIQVGTPQHTSATLNIGRCNTCHSGGGELSKVLHANDNLAACGGCHVPLGFELEGPIVVRTHFIHSRSNRFDAPLERCSSCHLTQQSIQRTSKAACLSCHKSYPQSHVQTYGPIRSIYVGGGRESFQQCASSCHTTHPNSGLN